MDKQKVTKVTRGFWLTLLTKESMTEFMDSGDRNEEGNIIPWFDMDFFVDKYVEDKLTCNGVDGCAYEAWRKGAATDWYLNMFLFNVKTQKIPQIHNNTRPGGYEWHLPGPARTTTRQQGDLLEDWITHKVKPNERVFVLEKGRFTKFVDAVACGRIVWKDGQFAVSNSYKEA